jgi:hypothetical protein
MQASPKVRRLAYLIMEKHGDDALAVVTERAASRLDVGDYPLVEMWARVASVVSAALPQAKPYHSPDRSQPALGELMNDSVMDAMVGDDDQKRSEVHRTLRRAKHKLQQRGN